MIGYHTHNYYFCNDNVILYLITIKPLMKLQPRLRRLEYLVYGIILLFIIVAPTLSTLFHGHDIDETEFLKKDFLHTLKVIAVYVIAFAIHDLVIAPLLVNKHKPWLYILGVVVLGTVFMIYQTSDKPSEPTPPASITRQQALPPPKAPINNDIASGNLSNAQIKPDVPGGKQPLFPPPLFRRHDILSLIMFLFGIGTNLGVKFYFRSVMARKELEDLEKVNLRQSLDQLRYQLHPHFFMNTLNNIHALVDIDPKRAQECIIDLSKLMRYVLYESNRDYVPALLEHEFMENYVSLSRIRYSDNLKFSVTTPDLDAEVWIPPLIFISFVENAFKHGVSHNKESFIEINTKLYDDPAGGHRLLWTCHNSKRNGNGNGNKKVSEASGIGLTNIRQRLDLMFGNNYTLDITDGKDDYLVKMDIPIFTSNPNTSPAS